MKCTDCKFCVLVDNGYSNYTVEGTDFYCGKKCHPKAPFDHFYGTEKLLEHAEKCPNFTSGEKIHIDVNREEVETLTAEQLEIYKTATK